MPDKADEKDTASQLRREAERRLREQTDEMQDPSQLSPEETRRLLHELRVHQIELEMQNEELCRAQKDLQAARDRYADLYDFAPVGYMSSSEKGIIQQANLTATRLLDVPRSDLIGKPLTRFILPEDQDIHYLHRQALFDTGAPQVCELRLRGGDETPFWVEIHGTLAHDGDGAPVCRCAITDVSERKRVEAEKEQLISELTSALGQIRKLSGLLPICSHCKKIRDDKGYWNQIESYIRDHSEAEFSHSICRECAKKYYPDMDLYDESEHY